MSLDVYAPCPCGSGKKVKFCCIDIIDEMDKIERLHENNQLRMALKILDDLEAKSPQNRWVLLRKATLLMEMGDDEEARSLLEDFVQANPDVSDGMALYAALLLRNDGYEPAKPALYRALQKPTVQNVSLLAALVNGIADLMGSQDRHMSARQHLVLAIRLTSEQNRQQAFMDLLEFDSDKSVPFPLRSVHDLATYDGPEELAKDAARATRLAQLGCFETAAAIFEKLTEAAPENAHLHYNHGVCRAWDSDEVTAAAALHRAAELEADFERAVEFETIAQLLDRNTSDDQLEVASRMYKTQQTSRLLSRLDDEPHLVRSRPLSQEESHAAARYLLLDRPQNEGTLAEWEAGHSLPTISGQISIFEPDDDSAAALVALIYRRDEQAADMLRLFESFAGEYLESTAEDDVREDVIDFLPREDEGLNWRFYVPSSASLKVRRAILKSAFRKFVDETWPNTPLIGLGGKTPLEAAGDPAYRLRLTAAVHVLDAICEQNDQIADLVPLWPKLQLEPPRPYAVDPAASLASLSPMQLDRLRVEDLSDTQLSNLVSRVMLLRHQSFEEKLLAELLKRPACVAQVDVNRIYGVLVQIARARFDLPQSLYWIREALAKAEGSPQSFELVLSWQMQELMLRLENPDDPELQPLLKRLWDNYGRKIPHFREQLTALAQAAGAETPWGDAQGIVTPDGTFGDVAGAVTGGGVWTPGGSNVPSSSGEGRKLWIPGLE